MSGKFNKQKPVVTNKDELVFCERHSWAGPNECPYCTIESLTQEVKELRQEMSCPFCAESVIRGEDGEAIPLQNKAVLEQATRAEQAEAEIELWKKGSLNTYERLEQAEQQRDDYRKTLSHIVDSMELTPNMDAGEFATLVYLVKQALQQDKG